MDAQIPPHQLTAIASTTSYGLVGSPSGSQGGGKSSVDPVSDVDRHPEWDFFSCLKLLLYQGKLLLVHLFCVFYRIFVNGIILVKVLFCLLDLLSFYLARMHTGVKDKYLGVPGFEGDEVWLEVLKLLRLTP